jgi:hypothetical protein
MCVGLVVGFKLRSFGVLRTPQDDIIHFNLI